MTAGRNTVFTALDAPAHGSGGVQFAEKTAKDALKAVIMAILSPEFVV